MDKVINIKFYDFAGDEFKFSSLDLLKNFLVKEIDFWNSKREQLKSKSTDDVWKILNSQIYLTPFLKLANEFYDKKASFNDTQAQNELSQYLSNNSSGINLYWLHSGNGCVDAILKIHSVHNSTVASAFANFVLKNYYKASSGNNDYSEIIGAFIGIKYKLGSDAEDTATNSESKSLKRLKDEFTKEKDAFITKGDEAKNSYDEWFELTKNSAAELLDNSRTDNKKENNDSARKFDELINECNRRFEELESIYEEKLRLSKPAKYWADSASKYFWQGVSLTILIIISVLSGIITFGNYLHGWLNGIQMQISLNSLEGVFLFGASTAIFAFWLKTLSRMTFSTFHLMRDAQEREQLTYLYLSLSNEKVVDEKSREIVLQALFSRSETGLLNNEHGPTMPGVDIIKGLSGKS